MSKAGINRNLDNAGFTGANNNPNNPGTTNPFATDAEIDILQQQINNISGGTGNFVISGNVSWSGSGLIYDVTTHVYVIQGTQYTSAATQVTLTADPTFDQYWVVYGDSTGAVGTIAGVPAPVPVPPSVDGLTQIVFATILVPAGATVPVITEVTVYDEDAGTPTEWAGTSDDTNVNFASTNDPYQGTVSVETNLPLGTNREIIFTPAAPYTIVSPSTLVFQIKAKQDMSAAAGRLYIGFFNGGSLVGNAIYIGGTTVPLYGFDATDTSAYQIVSIPFAAFGVLPATVDALRFFKLSGTSDADFFLDDVHILEGGAVTPPTTILFLNDLGDVTTGLPITPTNADDGRLLYFDVASGEWISDDIATISNVVKDCKTSVSTGSIAKGVPVYLAGFDNDLLVVEACDAANAATMPCIGVTAEALDATNAKKVISFGKLQGVNTAAFTEGDVLYVAAGGGFTTTRPTGTSLIQRIAVVLKADNPGGILKVINTSRTAGLPNLPQDNIWVGDANGYPQAEPLCPFLLTDIFATDTITACRWNGSSYDRYAITGQKLLDLKTDIEDEGTPLPKRPTIDFQGAGVTATDDALNNQTVVTIPGGGGGGASWEVEQYAYNMVPSGSSNPWNGTSVAGAGTGTLDSVFYFRSFSGVGGADGTFFNIVIPDDYTPGADIKVSLKTTINGSGGDYKFFVGFRKRETTFNRFPGDDSTTEWQSAAIAGQINWPMQTLDFVFSGTGVLPLDAVAILIYRDPSDVGDTISDTAYVNSAIVREN